MTPKENPTSLNGYTYATKRLGKRWILVTVCRRGETRAISQFKVADFGDPAGITARIEALIRLLRPARERDLT